MAQVTFTNHYKAGHSYKETWESTLIHCPKCARQGVWKDTSGGDYYAGEQHICPGCEFSFYMPGCGDCRDHNDQQRLVAIRGYKPELPMGSALETCSECRKPLPPLSRWSMPACPECVDKADSTANR